ncbi:helix-turn-helix domain-containing protein [Mycolicibacterium komossense]|uniref:Helix-turn-helix transcriptional regulator n=1 Tax=Mycolicibacterium komossense TaxID=1779 RepID=A0ABT3CKM1_9MYCO|nr:helix-turn-helix domain-containing protein [Mycolicibacterium komossense]MCV7230078.1 helix-turn-helix transcriptional regulator [Mycolicibacterium komossense]
MVRQARSEATRRKILDAAIELFSEVGFAATSLGDIIERAEMTKGALYYHFESKESLASAIIEERRPRSSTPSAPSVRQLRPHWKT